MAMRQRADGTWEDDYGNPVPGPGGAGGSGGRPLDTGAGGAGGNPGNDNGLGAAGGKPGGAEAPVAAPASPAGASPGASPGAEPLAPLTPVYVPGGMQTTGADTTVSGLDEKSRKKLAGLGDELSESQKRLDAANETAKANVRKAGGIAKADAGDEAAYSETVATEAAAWEKRQREMNQSAEAAIQQRAGVLEAESKRLRELEIKDFYADDPKGERRLWAGLQIAAGGLAASMRSAAAISVGQSNQFHNNGLDIVRDVINRDYRRQVDAIAKQERVVAGARSDMQDARVLNADALARAGLERAAKLDAAAKELAKLKASRGADRAAIAEDAAVNSLTVEAEQARRGVIKDQAILIQQQAQQVQSRTTKQFVPGQMVTPGQNADPLGVYVDGALVGKASSEKAASEIREANNAYRGFRETLLKLKEEMTGGLTTGDAMRRRESLLQEAIGRLKQASGIPGVMTDADAERFEKQLAAGFDLRSGNATRIDQTLKGVDANHSRFLGSHSLDPKRTMPAIQGEVVPQKRDLPRPDGKELAELIALANKGDATAAGILQGMGYNPAALAKAAKRR